MLVLSPRGPYLAQLRQQADHVRVSLLAEWIRGHGPARQIERLFPAAAPLVIARQAAQGTQVRLGQTLALGQRPGLVEARQQRPAVGAYDLAQEARRFVRRRP